MKQVKKVAFSKHKFIFFITNNFDTAQKKKTSFNMVCKNHYGNVCEVQPFVREVRHKQS